MVTLNYVIGVAETTELLRGAQREMTKGTRHDLNQGRFLLCLRKKFFTCDRCRAEEVPRETEGPEYYQNLTLQVPEKMLKVVLLLMERLD